LALIYDFSLHQIIMSQIIRSSLFILLLLSSSLSQAEETVRVLGSKSIQSGGRTITFQRIEPPAPKPVPKSVISEATAEEKVGVVPWRYRRFELLSLSCTVMESGVTSVRWWHEGKEYRILSSIDFNWLRGIGHFQTAEREYSVFLGVGNEMPVEVRNRLLKTPVSKRTEVPAFLIDESSKTESRYVIEAVPEKGAEAEAFVGINDLHRHFDAHREELIAQAAENEARQKENEAYLKAHPPVPQDFTVRFAPIKGSRYLQGKPGGSGVPLPAAQLPQRGEGRP
jgi:hypothetical protein